MERQTRLRKLGNIEIEQKSRELISRCDVYRITHFDKMTDTFNKCFEGYARNVAHMQQEGKKEAIAFVNFSVLRTNILAKRHFLRIDAYGKNWYADRAECVGEYEASEIYQWLGRFESALEGERKQSGGQISLAEIQALVFEESEKYLLFVTEVIRAGMKKAVKTESYKSMSRCEVFSVLVGDFQDQCRIVYKEDRTVKDAKAVKRHLQSKRKRAYDYEICDGLDLSQGDYGGIALLFSSFSNCDLTGANFKKSMLVACDFRNAILKDADMERIDAFDIDFGGAALENVSFRGAKLNRLSFDGAKLENVSFDGVLSAENLDFDGAELVGTAILQ